MMREIFPNIGLPQTLDEVLKAINCDFVAEQVPIFQMAPKPEDPLNINVAREIPNYSLIRRGDNFAPLGINSARYGLAQYKDTLSFLNDIVGSNDAIFQSAVATDNGARIYIAMKAPQSMIFAPGDEIECFYTASTSHDGKGSIQLMFSPVHKKSQTILTSLDSGVISMRHTVKVKDRIARAAGTVNKMNEVWTRHADRFSKFSKLTLTDDDVRGYFAMIVPSDTEEVHPRTQNVRDKLFDLYKGGMTSQLPSCKDTLLGAFVAALIFGDYYKTVRQSIVGRSEKDAMIESRLTGTAARFKADAFAACMKLVW